MISLALDYMFLEKQKQASKDLIAESEQLSQTNKQGTDESNQKIYVSDYFPTKDKTKKALLGKRARE